MSGEVLDFTKRAARSVRESRRSCVHTWRKTVRLDREDSRVERCGKCGDTFPCRGWACLHLDCILRGLELGRRRSFPSSFPLSVRVLADGHSGQPNSCGACAGTCGEDHYMIDVDLDSPPERWLLPAGLRVEVADTTDTTIGGDQ